MQLIGTKGFFIFGLLIVVLAVAACSGESSGTSDTDEASDTFAPDDDSSLPEPIGMTQWVNVWQAPPTDAAMPFDMLLTWFRVGPSQTFRSIFSPSGSGDVVRVHLSNRFGKTPVTFDAVWIARRTSGAAVDPATTVRLLFNKAVSVTIPVGADVVSDPASFHFSSFDDIAVSIYAADPGGTVTRHCSARQYSYTTAPRAGDHSGDAAGDAFTQKLALRPFVIGMDTLASSSTGVVVTLGDSLTDGVQSRPTFPWLEEPSTIDRNLRYPDDLGRRLNAAGRAVFVSNAGISLNQVLRDAFPLPYGGPSVLHRLDSDVLRQAGVTDVIFWQGINDLGLNQGLTAQDLIAGYVEVIGQLHARGINVIQGTLTPCGNAHEFGYGTSATTARRGVINDWIRTQSPADAVVDFDAAVRDPLNPDIIDARYDGGDGLHFNSAGYERLAAEIRLDTIRGASTSR